MAGARRSYRRYLRALLLLDEPPEKTARAYAIGVFVGFSPLVGLHTLIAIAIIVLFRVNRIAILLGTYTNTPWTWPLGLALGTGLGLWLLGIDAPVPRLPTEALWSAESYVLLFEELQGLLLPFMLGNFLLAAALALVAYFVARVVLLRHRRRLEDRAGSSRSVVG